MITENIIKYGIDAIANGYDHYLYLKYYEDTLTFIVFAVVLPLLIKWLVNNTK